MPVSRRLSWLVIERGRLHADAHALVLEQDGKTVEVAPAAFAALLLEPGVTVTHEAVRRCADHRLVLFWVGQAGTRIYAASAIHADARRIVAQALLYSETRLRIAAAQRLYHRMFGDSTPPSYSIEKLRGIEGARVRKRYEQLATEHGLTWDVRGSGAPLQVSISSATSCLYSLSEVAVMLLGFSPAIGIVHSGDPRSFVYDVADTVKFDILMPAVFRWQSEGMSSDFGTVRRRCRDLFRETSLLDTLLANADFLVFGDDGSGRT